MLMREERRVVARALCYAIPAMLAGAFAAGWIARMSWLDIVIACCAVILVAVIGFIFPGWSRHE
jgi:hypothetical protein